MMNDTNLFGAVPLTSVATFSYQYITSSAIMALYMMSVCFKKAACQPRRQDMANIHVLSADTCQNSNCLVLRERARRHFPIRPRSSPMAVLC